MVESLKKIRPLAVLAMAGMLAVQGLGIAPQPVQAAAAKDDCLILTGSGSVPVTDVDIDQEFEIEYTLTPDGDYTVVAQREPVNISLVLDVSGSMLYGLNGSTNAKAPNRRVDALRTATTGLIAKFKETNLDSVGLVQFSTKASKVALKNEDSKGLSKNYTDLQAKINALNPSGSTNIDDALRKAKDMLAGSSQKKYVIMLTDGAANKYGTNGASANNSSLDPTSKARTEALVRANELKAQGITAYTIGLMTPDAIQNINNPNVANNGEMDVYLMNQIATRTGGQFYTAADSASLAEVFKSIVSIITDTTLRNITLKQPLPTGFVLADSELSNPHVKVENGYIIMQFDDIPYPFEKSSYTKRVKLKATSDINGDSHPLSDATVSYVNACSNTDSFTIKLDSTIRILGIAATDMYGNKYYGNYRGELTRKRADDGGLQWTYNDPDSRRITAIDFVKPDGTPDDGTGKQHTLVKLSFASGDPVVLDLRPSAPAVQAVNADGKELGSGTWASGAVVLRVTTPSTSKLADMNGQIVYTNVGQADFQSGFIKGYEYTLDQGATWNTLPYNNGEYSVTLTGEGIYNAAVRAVNETISLQSAKPVYSDTASASAQLDNTPPTAQGKVTIQQKDGVQDDARILLTASDTLSPITSMQIWLDDGSAAVKQVSGASADFLLSSIPGYSEAASRYGWHQVKVTVQNAAGLSTTYGFGELVPDFKINPGPEASIGLEDHAGKAYSSSVWADKPIKVTVSASHPVTARYGNPEVTVVTSQYAIIRQNDDRTYSAPAWKNLSSASFHITPSGGTDKGVFKVGVKLTDADGIEREFWSDEVKIDYNQNRY
jgi:Mg-chelatase subunit ChlD